jgi:5-histidylcysteine sulfoxide synthase
LNKLSIYPPTLDGKSVLEKRLELKEYFLNTYTLYEKIFDVLKDDDVFYKKSEATRHPMIFYFGHTATFFINKLINMGIIDKRVNPNFESIFAVGVDEMSWDDVDSNNYRWPKVDEVRAYRDEVKSLVLKLIDELPLSLPISWDSEMWIILMGIEHERIHIETSLVLHRQMPLEFVKDVKEFNISKDSDKTLKNELVTIPTCQVILGKNSDDKYYGWDNEYGELKEDVEEFKCSKYLVSNGEYMEFVLFGGYEKKEFWSKEGLEFLKRSNTKYPPFWILEDGEFFYRTLSSKIKMPKNFPVDVNALEAEAFCNYKSKKDGVIYQLPSEAEYEAICRHVGVDDLVKDDRANLDLTYFSSCSVDKYQFKGIFDVVGNVWQWSKTAIYPFDGFRVHEAYDDFTVPTYDDKHALILGSSWASSGNLIMKKSRYAFRRHFYQNAGFRYVVSNPDAKSEKKELNIQEDVLKNYRLQHETDFTTRVVEIVLRVADKKQKALDLACGVGVGSISLAQEFESVDGVDYSTRFIKEALKTPNEKVEFYQGDPRNLKPNFCFYDLVLFTNLRERFIEVDEFLSDVKSRLNPDAVLILVMPKESKFSCDMKFLDKEIVQDYIVWSYRYEV